MLSKTSTSSKKHQIYVIAERCKECSFCIEFCPKHALYQSAEINSKGYHIIDSDNTKCNGCGMCSMICPEFAIYVESTEEESQEAEEK